MPKEEWQFREDDKNVGTVKKIRHVTKDEVSKSYAEQANERLTILLIEERTLRSN